MTSATLTCRRQTFPRLHSEAYNKDPTPTPKGNLKKVPNQHVKIRVHSGYVSTLKPNEGAKEDKKVLKHLFCAIIAQKLNIYHDDGAGVACIAS
jgi:hypothetical protein